MEQVLAEAQKLKSAGVKELLIISQDTSAYGVDKKYTPIQWQNETWATKFYDLCKALSRLDIWVRLHYVYPYPHVDEIIPLMSHDGLLPYLDIPLQHSSPTILKAMRRPANQENTLKRIENWRKICPDISIRSSFIVGFPGETDADFRSLLQFLETAELDRVGCFEYSPVEGAAANNFAEHISPTLKAERYAEFMEVQARISARKLAQKKGQILTVLTDKIENQKIIGRTYADAPEIDGLVYLPFEQNIKLGEFYQVRIQDADTYDLYGEWF
jgi:ribosomal protein S12 methylthiotransferase